MHYKVCKTLTVQPETAYRKLPFKNQPHLLEQSKGKGGGSGEKGDSGRNTPPAGDTHGHQTGALNLEYILLQ